MLKMLDPLREINFYSVAFRMILACICGGIIGIEREYKHRPAGFRTHILICLGASMTTHVTTTLSAIGTPPNTGIVKAVLLSSSSASVADKFPVFLPPFLSTGLSLNWYDRSVFVALILRSLSKKSQYPFSLFCLKMECKIMHISQLYLI